MDIPSGNQMEVFHRFVMGVAPNHPVIMDDQTNSVETYGDDWGFPIWGIDPGDRQMIRSGEWNGGTGWCPPVMFVGL